MAGEHWPELLRKMLVDPTDRQRGIILTGLQLAFCDLVDVAHTLDVELDGATGIGFNEAANLNALRAKLEAIERIVEDARDELNDGG